MKEFEESHSARVASSNAKDQFATVTEPLPSLHLIEKRKLCPRFGTDVSAPRSRAEGNHEAQLALFALDVTVAGRVFGCPALHHLDAAIFNATVEPELYFCPTENLSSLCSLILHRSYANSFNGFVIVYIAAEVTPQPRKTPQTLSAVFTFFTQMTLLRCLMEESYHGGPERTGRRR